MTRGDSTLSWRSTTLERRRCFLSCSSLFPGQQLSSTGVPAALNGCRLVPGDTNTLSGEALSLQPADWSTEELIMAREEKKKESKCVCTGH